eukprot:3237058-Amphidinium_carterae.1
MKSTAVDTSSTSCLCIATCGVQHLFCRRSTLSACSKESDVAHKPDTEVQWSLKLSERAASARSETDPRFMPALLLRSELSFSFDVARYDFRGALLELWRSSASALVKDGLALEALPDHKPNGGWVDAQEAVL